MDLRNYVYTVVSGGDHDLLMKAIDPYETVAFYGNMDPEVEEWLVVTILLPRQSAKILGRSLHEDYELGVKFCQNASDAEAVAKSHPSWA